MAQVIKAAIFTFECNGETITGTCNDLVLGNADNAVEIRPAPETIYRLPQTLSITIEHKAKTIDEKINLLDLCSTLEDKSAN